MSKKKRAVTKEFAVAEGLYEMMKSSGGGSIEAKYEGCENLGGCSMTIVVTDGPFSDYFKHVGDEDNDRS